MRVLLVNKFHYLKGGAERVYFDTKKLLESRGHEVFCFSMKDPRNEPCREERYFVENVDFGSHRSSLYKAGRYLYYREASRRLTKLVAAAKPDVAHVHNYAHQLSAAIFSALKRAGVPVVQTLHDYQIICPNYKLYTQGAICERCRERRYYQCVKHRCVQDSFAASALAALEMYEHWFFKLHREKADLFISPSEFLKNICAKWGVKNRIEVVHNFLSLKNFVPRYDADDYYLCATRFSREKGVLQLLQAAKDLPQCRLRLVGDGPEKPAIEKFLRENDCRHVELLDWQTDSALRELIAGARFCVVPSAWYENYPMVVLEAMALGKPVLASALGGLTEMIETEVTGWLYEPGNIDDLRRLIENNYHDTEKLARLGRAARQTVERNNSAEHHYEKLMACYDSVSQQGGLSLG